MPDEANIQRVAHATVNRDCAMRGCTEPIAGFVPVSPREACGRGGVDELGLCHDHIAARAFDGSVPWIRWVEHDDAATNDPTTRQA